MSKGDIDWNKAPEWAKSYTVKVGQYDWKYWLNDEGYQFGDDGVFHKFGSSDNSTIYYLKDDFEIIEERPMFVDCTVDGKIIGAIPDVKPVFTQQMADDGELPPVGILVQMSRNYGNDHEFYNGKLIASDRHVVWFCDDKYGDVLHPKFEVEFKPIDTRTNEEKTLDDLWDSYRTGEKLHFEKDDRPKVTYDILKAIKANKIHGVKLVGYED